MKIYKVKQDYSQDKWLKLQKDTYVAFSPYHKGIVRLATAQSEFKILSKYCWASEIVFIIENILVEVSAKELGKLIPHLTLPHRNLK